MINMGLVVCMLFTMRIHRSIGSRLVERDKSGFSDVSITEYLFPGCRRQVFGSSISQASPMPYGIEKVLIML
jgi:hypothetical protein